MSKAVLLNNLAHQDLRVDTRYGPHYGDDQGLVPCFPTEFADIQREYPIVLQRQGQDGALQAFALLGLEPDENLFLTGAGNGWDARYVPAASARGPFMIGFQDQSGEGGEERAAVIHIDMDNPRVGHSEGEAVFLEHGGNSPYLERITRMLSGINTGVALGRRMFAAFDELSLVEPVTFEVTLADGARRQLQGHYTLNEEKLAALPGDTLERLNRAGFLQGAYLILASLGNLQHLVARKNARLGNRG
jgi:SapC